MTRRIAFSLLFAIVLVISCAGSGKCQEEAERIWGLGENAFNAGRYGEAISYYQKSLSMCGGNYKVDPFGKTKNYFFKVVPAGYSCL